ncbi:MAG TPA: PaaI family thioesterase [Candidatus Sulfotelmatobacter sp.]|nr:PaaI family thioesterase [Candidatus Sulfotelmatobacter sp.]
MQDDESGLVRAQSRLMMEAASEAYASSPRSDQFVSRATSGQIAAVNFNCFVCGPYNHVGLRLTFENSSNGVDAIWVPNESTESFPETVHGGLIMSVLDEAMSKAIMARGWQAFTVSMNVRFHSRTSPGERLRVRGWIVEQRKRRILTEASLLTDTEMERSHAWATFLIPKRF